MDFDPFGVQYEGTNKTTRQQDPDNDFNPRARKESFEPRRKNQSKSNKKEKTVNHKEQQIHQTQPYQPMQPMQPMQPIQPMKPMQPMQPIKPIQQNNSNIQQEVQIQEKNETYENPKKKSSIWDGVDSLVDLSLGTEKKKPVKKTGKITGVIGGGTKIQKKTDSNITVNGVLQPEKSTNTSKVNPFQNVFRKVQTRQQNFWSSNFN
ncbi:hypothetical protein M0811_13547 [Anaeramoeba ignava]|uniref:Uncharacterized protein n=1 Tax=Anaeramoeba ignava TaxID=1746090 RepID=A0A9Q0R506_ANAIG|nr:hypothetical protein M0811_13547 [Anaeramoeba ignava]